MIEKHILGDFVPEGIEYLILGSFYAKGLGIIPGYDWYYGSRYNQFWKIIEEVYKVKLPNKESKIRLFTKLHIGLSDIIYSCERSAQNSSDGNLTNITYNHTLTRIIEGNNLKAIYFTSVYVRKAFHKLYCLSNENTSKIELVTLPSPSPRFAKLNKAQKVQLYINLLPQKPAEFT